MLLSTVNPKINLYSSYLSFRNAIIDEILKHNQSSSSCFSSHLNHKSIIKRLPCVASLKKPNSNSDHNTTSETRSQNKKTNVQKKLKENSEVKFPTTIPRKSRRGRKSEAAACEDIVRNSLEQTFASIREQNSETEDYKEKIMKDRVDEESDSNESDDESGEKGEKKMVIEEESSDWPLDADVGWGIRASDYFDKHPIKNIVGEDGIEIDWEGEIDDNWVQEINCLEWENFAFHPSPLVVFVFERYNRATENWKLLKELEKAIKVYWSAKDRLPPRAVKIDINIERDLAYALKVRECPQILFLRGNKIIYREKEFRTADELVHMIAHFYYKAKKPSWISDEAITSPF